MLGMDVVLKWYVFNLFKQRTSIFQYYAALSTFIPDYDFKLYMYPMIACIYRVLEDAGSDESGIII